jgi:hypothetical protein
MRISYRVKSIGSVTMNLVQKVTCGHWKQWSIRVLHGGDRMKVAASDYDGTLFRQDNIAAEDMWLGIHKWREAGHLFGVVTGTGLRYAGTTAYGTMAYRLIMPCAIMAALSAARMGAFYGRARIATALLCRQILLR